MQAEHINIIISRHGRRIQASVSMPVWVKSTSDKQFFNVNIPLLGIETIARDEGDDLELAVNEAVTLFFLVASKIGGGIEDELIKLGWRSKNDANNNIHFSYVVGEDDFVLEKLIETGDNFISTELELNAA